MAYPKELLSNIRIMKATCPKGKKQIYITDGLGLRLRIKPSTKGSVSTYTKYWVFRGKLNKKEINIGLGTYPETALAEARHLSEICRREIK